MRVIIKGSQTDIPQDIVKKLIENLIEITAYSTVHLGGITKRNYESLRKTLASFYSKEILELVDRQRKAISSKRAEELISRSIKNAKELFKEENRE